MKKQQWQKAAAAAALSAALLAAGVPAMAEAPAEIAAYAVSDTGSTTAAPKPSNIVALTAKPQGFTIKWQQRSKEFISGYQVQYATDKNFTQNRVGKMFGNPTRVSATFEGLKGKTLYYVRVRTYKTENGKNVFSAWSQVKTVTTQPAHVHTYENVVTKATLTADGKIVETCTGCGQTGKTTVISHPKTIQLAKANFVYDGNIKKPAVTVTAADGKVIPASNYTVTYPNNSKAVGKYTCKIVFKGNYQGTVTREFTITPKGTSIESLTADESSLTVKWAIRSKEVITGYQVQYATDKNFTQNRVGKMIGKNLTSSLKAGGLNSGTKYFVRVRTYRNVNGQNIFSAWTETKEVSTAQESRNIIASGTCGNNLTWALDDKGTLTISGTGSMKDYGYYSAEDFKSYAKQIKKVKVESGVTSIGESAFNGFDALTAAALPESVKAIGKYAFYNCSALSSMAIPNGVSTIGGSAFYSCSSLKNISIPGSVTTIEGGAFTKCSALTKIAIPNSVKTIGAGAFAWCTGLTAVKIPNSVTSVGINAFGNCTGLVSAELPAGITSIAGETFYNCKNLTAVKIPNSVTSIGSFAFVGCSSLLTAAIPNSVTSIGEWAFKGCSSLTSVAIPSKVTVIETNTFAECSSLTSVEIPNGVTTIGNSAFNGCSSLAEITIPGSVTAIGQGAFGDCRMLTKITLPNSVTSVGAWAFRGCGSLAAITIPNKVSCIEEGTFAECMKLETVTVPKNAASIKAQVFRDCIRLKKIQYKGTMAQWKGIAVDSSNTYLANADIVCTNGTIYKTNMAF